MSVEVYAADEFGSHKHLGSFQGCDVQVEEDTEGLGYGRSVIHSSKKTFVFHNRTSRPDATKNHIIATREGLRGLSFKEFTDLYSLMSEMLDEARYPQILEEKEAE